MLREGGLLYTVTDVHDLHLWMVKHLDEHPLFERVPDADLVRLSRVSCRVTAQRPAPSTGITQCGGALDGAGAAGRVQMDDAAMIHIMQSTEEGIKVARNRGDKWPAVYRRIPAP